MATQLNTIKRIAQKNDVRVSLEKDSDGDRVIVLHGFLHDIEAVKRQISGYHSNQRNDGVTLTKW